MALLISLKLLYIHISPDVFGSEICSVIISGCYPHTIFLVLARKGSFSLASLLSSSRSAIVVAEAVLRRRLCRLAGWLLFSGMRKYPELRL